MPLKPYLKRLIEQRETLTRAEATAALETILRGGCSDIQIAALLTALATRGETPEEIAGFVDAMRAAATPIPLTEEERSRLVDSCGTGGDHSNTFNISTAAALVAAAAGATVAKHGNRAVTSRSGSADVLEALGIPVDLTPEQAADALRRHRFAFLHAPALHPAMQAVMPVRRALGVRTVFNVVGPLSNPAGAPAQVMGVYSKQLVPIVAEVMRLLGTRHGFVVHGTNLGTSLQAGGYDGPPQGMDELSISGVSSCAEVRDGRIQVHDGFSHTDFAIRGSSIESLRGGTAAENAATLREIFSGELGPKRDVVVLNAGAILAAADLVTGIGQGVQRAQEAIDSGAVTELVAKLARTI